ncbi:MAG: tetratricopeptide repeat protein [Flavobacteriales bacterium]|nr:tetratricopeptide repeat protein [Flavobacteriales bacterium]
MMRFLSLVCIVLLGLPCLKAQDATMVSALLSTYRSAGSDSARAVALARISFHLIRSDPDSARLTGQQALRLASKGGSQSAAGHAYNSLGWLDAEQGRLDSAEYKLQRALAIFTRLQDGSDQAAVLLNLGWLAEKRGDDAASLKHFLQALGKAETARDSIKEATITYSIGVSYRKMGEYAQAADYLQRALRTETALGRKQKMANCLLALANTRRESGDVPTALSDYERAAHLFAEVKDAAGQGLVQENLGDHFAEHEPAKALFHYQLALDLYDISGGMLDKAYALLAIGKVRLKLGQHALAEEALKEASSLAAQTRSGALGMAVERSLADLAKARNDASGVYGHLERYLFLRDSLKGEANQRELARLRTLFETERKERENTELRAENMSQQERLKRRKILLFGSMALAILASAAMMLTWRNYRQKKKYSRVLEKLNDELGHSNADISEMNGLLEMRLLRSQMNPHFIYNSLASAAQLVQTGKQADALAYVQGFARLLRMVLEFSVRDRIPLEEEMEFLELYLKLESHRIPGLLYTVEADAKLIDEEVMVPGMLVQPFVENAIWHGLAKHEGMRVLGIRFSSTARGGVHCTVTDNGVGRETAARENKGDTHRSLGMDLTGQRLRLLARRLGNNNHYTVKDLRNGEGRPQGTEVNLEL